MNGYIDATPDQIETIVQNSWKAFTEYRKLNLKDRADFLRAIAKRLDKNAEAIIKIANKETNLEPPRLQVELTRTIFQLESYAQACEDGAWLDIRINTANAQTAGTNNNLPSHSEMQSRSKVDLRKMMIPLGPVVIFGASNFPFAYSTAGGDAACALAAGCTVIIKAHPAHAGTSEMVYQFIREAAVECNLPDGVFQHLHGASFEVGRALVQHPLVKAIGFTGSFEGGKALFDWANARPVPIPVFAEMSSVNPVFILPEKLEKEKATIASMYAESVTQSVGQFCTNPGIIAGVDGPAFTDFVQLLGEGIKNTRPAKMLHPGIAKSFYKKRTDALQQPNVVVAAETSFDAAEDEAKPTITLVDAQTFLSNTVLHKEIFGPYSIIVRCKNEDELLQVAKHMEGQLTATLMATDEEVKNNPELVETLKEISGRFIMNGVPTGVEVALGMQHGGPYPATTDSRFTAVGPDGIRRFARPISYQNWSNSLLPDELKNENPLGLWRTVNGQLTDKAIN